MKRAIACVLALVMCFTMTTGIGFASTATPSAGDSKGGELNVMVVGNSATSGYGLPDFVFRSSGFSVNNNYLENWAIPEGLTGDWTGTGETAWTKKAAEIYNGAHPTAEQGRMSTMSYPWLFKDYLVHEKGFDNVDLTSIALSGMRTDELRAFLDESFYQKVSDREFGYAQQYLDENPDKFIKTGRKDEHGFDTYYELKSDAESADDYVLDKSGVPVERSAWDYRGFMNAHMPSYINAFYKSGVIEHNDYEDAKDYVQQSIEDADVIVLDLCCNNYGTYVGFRLGAMLGMYDKYISNTYETIKDVDDLPPEMGKKIDKLMSDVIGKTGLSKNALAKSTLEAFMFGTAECIANFRENMEWINAHKKDGAKVIAVGLNNPMLGLKMDSNGQVIDLGQIIGGLFEMVNTYMKSFDKNTRNYYYADVPMDLSTFIARIADAGSIEELLSDGAYEDAGGYYAIEMVYDSFVDEFLGGEEALGPAAPAMKPVIQEMLWEAVAKHSTLNFSKLASTLSDSDGMAEAIMNYVGAKMTGADADMDEAYWNLIALEERFLLYNCVGVHPDREGYVQKFQAVRDAYESELTAHQQSIAEVKAMLEELSAKVRAVATQENIDAAIQLIRQIKSGIEYLEQSGYDLPKIAALSAQLQEDINKTLDMLGVTVEDLVAGGQFIADKVDPAVVAEQIQMMKEIVAKMPEMKAKLNQIIKYLKEQTTLISEENLAKIQRIREALKTAVEQEEYSELIDELLPIGLELLEIGKAVSNLPEYEEAMTAYMMANEEAMAGLGKRVTALEEQAGQVKARTIDVAVKSEVTFPNGKAKLTLSWEIDPIAEGYEMKINGEKVGYSEQGDMLVYEDANAQIGKAYSYEITPYVDYTVSKDTDQGVVTETRTAYGKTFKGTVTPKVSVATATIKKVKKAKKAFTVKWNAVSGANGYQVTYKLGKKSQTKNVAAGKTSLKVKKLKSGKKYTVKVRAYKTVNGKTYYGAWSAAKKVKVK